MNLVELLRTTAFRQSILFAGLMMAGAVAAGAATAYQLLTSKPGRPDSITVGVSGSTAVRFALVTAMPRNRPLNTCGALSTTFATSRLVCPPTAAVVAGAPPLYGTFTMRMPTASANSSPAMRPPPRMLATLQVSSRGRARASATSSLTLCAGSDGCTQMISGLNATRLTPDRSLSES